MHAHIVDPNKESSKKIFLVKKISRYLNKEKTGFSRFFKEKRMLLPPFKFTDLDKIVTGDTSHYGVPPCKISSKSEHIKHPNLVFENQKMEKYDFKIGLFA